MVYGLQDSTVNKGSRQLSFGFVQSKRKKNSLHNYALQLYVPTLLWEGISKLPAVSGQTQSSQAATSRPAEPTDIKLQKQ